MRAVNLLPADRVSGGPASGPVPRRTVLAAGGGVMLAATVGLVLLVWSADSSVGHKRNTLDALQTKIAKIPAPIVASSSTATGAPARASTVSSLIQDRLSWDGFLGAFSRVIPEDVWLETLQANSPGAAATLATATPVPAATTPATGDTATTTTPVPAAPASTPSTFTITGFTYSQPSVARLMRRLTLVPWLSDVNLVSSGKTAIDKTTVYQFTVGASVIPQPGEAS